MAIWFRVGNFYRRKAGVLTNTVSFKSPTSAIIKEISVSHYSNGTTRVTVTGSQFHYNELKELLRPSFCDAECDFGLSVDEYIKFYSIESFQKARQMLNQKYGCQTISSEVIAELEQMSSFLRNENKSPQHIISEGIFGTSHVNPFRKNSKEFAELLRFSDKFQIDKFKKFLLNGEDTNQSYDSFSPLSHVILSCKIKEKLYLIKLLLGYGGNPFYRADNILFISPIEHAKKHDDVATLNFIIAAATTLEKPITKPKCHVNIKTKLSDDRSQAVTMLDINIDESGTNKLQNNTLTTYIKNLNQLKDEETAAVFKLFEDHFEAPSENPTNLFNVFKKYFSGKNKFIELIFDREMLVGFILFAVTISPTEKNILVSPAIALVLPAYRSNGIITLLGFRPAYSLQLLYPDYVVNVDFDCAHRNTHDIIKDLLYFPKYQPQSMANRVKKERVSIVHDELVCYIDDDLRVKGGYFKRSNNVIQDFLFREMLGLKEDEANITSARSIPVRYPIGDESFSKLFYLCDQMGIQLDKHIAEFTACIQEVLPSFNKNNKIKEFNIRDVLKSSQVLFWKGCSPYPLATERLVPTSLPVARL